MLNETASDFAATIFQMVSSAMRDRFQVAATLAAILTELRALETSAVRCEWQLDDQKTVIEYETFIRPQRVGCRPPFKYLMTW